ncbi:flavin reductase family protein [Staphylococcus canis]|uniref:Flavin reductase family protein n=1 Tax=Staphylococcus canis TaxID=2724942 RepID=A0ABS0TAF6_9STAP|nr:flavin reductase family protein [Staphylococcus canis]MBI5975736.1 flavin reductase family protein [Staphylococcus canis]
MIRINPDDLTQKENYKLLIGSIIPRPIALVTSVSSDGVLNIAPFSFFNIVASDPPIISVAVQRKEGAEKDTAQNIKYSKEAVVHIVDEDNVKDANQTAALLDHDQSELDRTNFHTLSSDTVAIPGLEESKVRFECELFDVHVIEREGRPVADLLLLEVKQYHFNDKVYDNGYVIKDELKAVSRLAGNDYAKIGDTFTIERPQK